MELTIDTSTGIAGIALSNQGETVVELTWNSGHNHTVELVPNIAHLLDEGKASPQSLHAIFVARGPGGFNGLRVGISTAKGMAFALGIPLIGVSTLEIEAYPFAYTGLPLCPVHSAGRGEIAVAIYRQTDEWRCLVEEHITTVDTLCEQVGEETLFCGEIPQDAVPQLQQRLGSKAIIPGPAARVRRAGYLAALGWRRLEKGEQDNAASLQPLYLRQPPITQRKVR